MDKLTYLYDKIDDEFSDSKGYLKHAIKCKEHSPEMANLLFKLSSEELQHAQLLQAMVTQEIATSRKNDESHCEELTAIHEWLRVKHADCIKDIKRMQDVFAGK